MLREKVLCSTEPIPILWSSTTTYLGGKMDEQRKKLGRRLGTHLRQEREKRGFTQNEVHAQVRAEAWRKINQYKRELPRIPADFDPFPLRTLQRFEGGEGGSEPPATFVQLFESALGLDRVGEGWVAVSTDFLAPYAEGRIRQETLRMNLRLTRPIPVAVFEYFVGQSWDGFSPDDSETLIEWLTAAMWMGERPQGSTEYRERHSRTFQTISELPDHALTKFLLHLIDAAMILAKPTEEDSDVTS